METSKQPAEGIPSPPPTQEYKEKCNTADPTAANLASSSYNTQSYYTLNKPPLWHRLLPPTWDLNQPDDTPPLVPKKWRRQRNKQKAPPVKHKYLHAAFCSDSLCPYHR
jgi:hypothetical protein